MSTTRLNTNSSTVTREASPAKDAAGSTGTQTATAFLDDTTEDLLAIDAAGRPGEYRAVLIAVLIFLGLFVFSFVGYIVLATAGFG